MRHSEWEREQEDVQLELPTLISKLAHLCKENTHFAGERFAEIVQVPVPQARPATDRQDRVYMSTCCHTRRRDEEEVKGKKRGRRNEMRESDPIWRQCSLWRGTVVWDRTLVGRHGRLRW